MSGADGWHPDPHNPETLGEHGNSILRLGISALIKDARGDGKIESRAFKHDPELFTYFDVFSKDAVAIRFRTLRGDAESVHLVLQNKSGDAETVPMHLSASDNMFDFFERTIRPSENGDIPGSYTFEVTDGDTVEKLNKNYDLALDNLDLVETPDWAKRAIWYQIMIDRFRDGDASNNPEHTKGTHRSTRTHPWKSEWYEEQPWERENGQTFWEWSMYERLYGGDFQGVIDQLDYLQELGITAIYFNPVFEANNSHKYNGRSYTHADDGYGTPGEFARSLAEEDFFDSSTWIWNESDKKFLELIDECHKRDIKVIIDGVFNHLGEQAVPFLDVKKNKRKSRFADWYIIHSWDPFEYSGWAGFGGLPEFAKDPHKGLASDSLLQYIYDVTERWMDPNGDGDPSDGIDGWRLDVPMEVPKVFWEGWQRHVKSINPEAYTTGEIWHPEENWMDGSTFDAVMNYPVAKLAFRFFGDDNNKISASEFDSGLARHRIRYPRAITYALQNLYDSHDTDRWVSRLANPDHSYDDANRIQDSNPDYFDERPAKEHYQRQKLMALFQVTYVGAPMIWYGTEVGMYGADDPMCRMPMWWEDMMPYADESYFVDKNLFSYFQGLFKLRTQYEALNTGDFHTLVTDDKNDVYAYMRHIPGAPSVIVMLNNSSRKQAVTVPTVEDLLPDGLGKAELVFGDASFTTDTAGVQSAEIPPVSGIILVLNP